MPASKQALPPKQLASNEQLKTFYQFLKTETEQKRLSFHIRLKELYNHLNKGLYLSSNIPQGYGLGSSGAVVAAVYHNYVIPKNACKLPLASLRVRLALMEAFFHGASSGIDPLICYLNQALLIKSQQQFEKVVLPTFNKQETTHAFFVVDTQQARPTKAGLVPLFIKKLEQREFKAACEQVLTPINKACIEAYLNKNAEKLYYNMRKLSRFQWQHFQPMIPQHFKTHWQHGLTNEIFSLKICGAGGGGFMLGFTQRYQQVKQYFGTANVHPIAFFLP